MGSLVTPEHLHNFHREIKMIFQMLDIDNSNALRMDEFVEGLLRITDSSTVGDRHVLIRMERLCASIALASGIYPRDGWRNKWESNQRKLEKVFRALDVDGDGYIDVEELKKLFSVSIEDQGG